MKLPVFGITAFLLVAPVIVCAQEGLESKFQSLQDAVAKADATQVKTLSTEVIALASQACGEPAPQSPDDQKAWKERVDYAKSAQNYAEYSLYSTAVKSEPAVMVDLMAALVAANPKSEYLDRGYASYLYALGQTGATSKIPAIAEKGLANFPDNVDLLRVLADNAMAAKQTDRAANYATRLAAAANKATKPEGMADADFAKWKGAALMRGYWMAGVIAGEKGQYAAADRNLRAALPLIQGNNAMLAPALFYLGVANYNIGKATLNKARVLEGAKFSDQCAAITSAYTTQAWNNSAIMKKDAAAMK